MIQYDAKGKEIARFESIKEATLKTGIAGPNIIHVLKGRGKLIKATAWKYVSNSYTQK